MRAVSRCCHVNGLSFPPEDFSEAPDILSSPGVSVGNLVTLVLAGGLCVSVVGWSSMARIAGIAQLFSQQIQGEFGKVKKK